MTDGGQPELRTGRPWVMEDMMAAIPELIGRMHGMGESEELQSIAVEVVTAAAQGRPVVVSGCGTSEHAAMGIAAQLAAAVRARGGGNPPVQARQAFEAWLDPALGGLHVAVSHEGATAATVAALRAARQAGATTALVTAEQNSAAARVADRVALTPLRDRSWCHTIGYVSPLLVGCLLAGAIEQEAPDLERLASAAETALDFQDQAEQLGERIASAPAIIVAGSGADAIGARELALKIREGARIPAVGYPLETVLHGYLVAAEGGDALILVATDSRAVRERGRRGTQLLRAARHLGLRTAAILTEETRPSVDTSLLSAGSLVVPQAGSGLADGLLAAALGLQLLTVGLVAARGTNPDLIRREEVEYRRAAAAAETEHL